MTKQASYHLFLQSTLCFTGASVLETILHEGAHFVACLAVGGQPTLFHNAVQYDSEALSETARLTIAAAGPLVSLLIGILFHFRVMRRPKSPKSTGYLFGLYMAVFGYIGFFGYMMIAPFFTYGDTGFVLRAIGCPGLLIIGLSILSVGLLWWLMHLLSDGFVALMSTETASDEARRGQFVLWLVLWPFFAGLVLYTLLSLPVPTFLSLIAPIFSPFSLLWVYGDYLRRPANPARQDETESITGRVTLIWWAVLIAIILLNRFLVSGFSM